MKKFFILLCASFTICSFTFSQSIGIGTPAPHSSSLLDITSTSKGILIPRMSTAVIGAISNPAKGLMVYDSVKNQLVVNMGTASSPDWQTIVSKSGWSISGNSGTNSINNFIGTTDASPLIFKVNNVSSGILDSVRSNSFFGYAAGQNALTSVRNTGIGRAVLRNNTTGQYNFAGGAFALTANMSGSENVAIGDFALGSNTSGNKSVAIGNTALAANTTGDFNVAIGAETLRLNTFADENTSVGFQSMYYNTSGRLNTVLGGETLQNNTTGNYNVAVGVQALIATSSSDYNTAVGSFIGGSHNLGYNNTLLGANCDVNASGLYNCIAIGQGVTCTANSQARIGNSATTSIGGYVGWSNISDGRFKKNIQDNVKGLDFIMKLHPVTYQLDVQGISNFLNEGRGQKLNDAMMASISEKEKMFFSGFIAQDVEAVAKNLGYNFSGVDAPKDDKDLYSLRYAEFVVPLTKAVQEQQELIAEQKQMILDLQKRLEALESKMK